MIDTIKSFDKRTETGRGFTIVELLIVIVVIGILAAIVVVAFSGIKNRADAAAVQTDLKNFAQKAGIYYTHNGVYPTSSQLVSLEWKPAKNSYQQSSGGNALYCAMISGPDARFTIAARTSNNTAYTYSSNGGIKTYTGAWTGAWLQDCKAHGYPSDATPLDPAFAYAQGYHPPGWGSPGWKTWSGAE